MLKRFNLIFCLMLIAASVHADRLTLLVNPYGGLLLARVDVTSTGTAYLLVTEAQPVGGVLGTTTDTLTLKTNQDDPSVVGSAVVIKDCNLRGTISGGNLTGGFLVVKLIPQWGATNAPAQILWSGQVEPALAAVRDLSADVLAKAIWRVGGNAGWNNAKKLDVIQTVSAAAMEAWKRRLDMQFGVNVP